MVCPRCEKWNLTPLEERWDAIAATDVCRRWWRYMSEVMPAKPDGEPLSRPLPEVFHL